MCAGSPVCRTIAAVGDSKHWEQPKRPGTTPTSTRANGGPVTREMRDVNAAYAPRVAQTELGAEAGKLGTLRPRHTLFMKAKTSHTKCG